MKTVYRIGTRASRMAVAQAEAIRDALQKAHPDLSFELVTRATDADRDTKSRLGAMGGKGGAFINDMREMMLDGTADLAMHSLKDLPGDDEYYDEKRFVIGACMPRDDARDALVLKPGGSDVPDVIGTSSIRRRAYLSRLFPQAEVVQFRGSADLRLRRLDTGEPMQFNYGGQTPPVDALVLAASGLERIGEGSRISRRFEVTEMLPAVGQGVVVAECLGDDPVVTRLLAAIDHRETRWLMQAERAMLRALNGHCDSPIGGYSWIANGKLNLRGAVISPDGKDLVEVIDATPYSGAADLGMRVGRRLNALGGATIIEESRYAD